MRADVATEAVDSTTGLIWSLCDRSQCQAAHHMCAPAETGGNAPKEMNEAKKKIRIISPP